MNNGLSKILFFAAGASGGSVATWKFVEEKYKRIADEEIESVKEHLRVKMEDFPDKGVEEDVDEAETEKLETEESKPKAISTTSIKEIKKANYVDYSAISHGLGYLSEPKEDNTEKQPGTSPYIIDQNDFGMIEDYSVDSMLYHEDDYLTDENNVLIDNIENSVGYECLNEFKESNTDVVYVRNDETKTDYEILKVDTNYKDLVDQEE